MSKNRKLIDLKNETKPVLGRKRDDSLDATILDAALDALAEFGYDQMTMDLVAEKAKTGKATMYRRWASKTELVLDALRMMNSRSVNLTELPDTGSIREDLLAVVKPKSAEEAERKLKVLSGLGSFFTEYRKISEDISEQILGGWEKANRELLERAAERGEITRSAGISEACRVISAMTVYTTTFQMKTFNKSSYEKLLDDIVLPALGAGAKRKN